MDLQLKDAKVLVTGSSKGLGLAAARQFLMEDARVMICSRSETNLQQAINTLQQEGFQQVFSAAGDLSQAGEPKRIIHQAVDQLGGLDILITNTGGPPSGMFEDFDDQQWNQAFNLSLMSHVRLIRAALPILKKSSIASVLTVTSISVKQPIANLVLSNSVRAATVGLTKSLALELGQDGIRFNSILPGWTETGRVKELMKFRAETNETTVEEELRKQAAESPLGRMAKPEEFARAAAFLASPAAAYITGVMLTVDGGMYKGLL